MGINAVISTNNEYARKNVPFDVFLTVNDYRGNKMPESSSYYAGDGWTKSDFTLISDSETSPIGTTNASKLQALNAVDSYMSAGVSTFTAGDVIVTSVYMWVASGTLDIYLSSKATSTWTGAVTEKKTVTTNPTRFYVTRTATDTTNTVVIGGDDQTLKPDAGFYYVWGVQMEKGPLGSLYETSGAAVTPSTAANIKEIKLRLFDNGSTSAFVSGVASNMHERNTSAKYFTIPLSSSTYAHGKASVGETGASYARSMFRWFDIRADVQIDNDTAYPQINVNDSVSNILTRGVIDNPSVEYSGMKDFSKFENSGYIP